MSKPRTELFYIEGVGHETRNNLLRDFVATIYNVAKVKPRFTTDDVFAAIGAGSAAIRKATANSKLIAVALRKATERGICYVGSAPLNPGDDLCHGRRKTVWVSKIAAPQHTS